MQEMSAISSSAKVSADYEPLQVSTSSLSDETNFTASSRKKKKLRRAGAVNFDEDENMDGDNEMETSATISMNKAAVTSKYESPARSDKNVAKLASSNEEDDNDLNIKINFNNHPVRKSPEAANLELSEFSTRKSN